MKFPIADARRLKYLCLPSNLIVQWWTRGPNLMDGVAILLTCRHSKWTTRKQWFLLVKQPWCVNQVVLLRNDRPIRVQAHEAVMVVHNHLLENCQVIFSELWRKQILHDAQKESVAHPVLITFWHHIPNHQRKVAPQQPTLGCWSKHTQIITYRCRFTL